MTWRVREGMTCKLDNNQKIVFHLVAFRTRIIPIDSFLFLINCSFSSVFYLYLRLIYSNFNISQTTGMSFFSM